MPGFHLHQNPLCLACIVINESDDSINTLVAAFFAFSATFLAAKWPGADQGECPPLELIAVIFCKFMRSSNVSWLTYHFEFNSRKHGFHAVFLQGNTQMG